MTLFGLRTSVRPALFGRPLAAVTLPTRMCSAGWPVPRPCAAAERTGALSTPGRMAALGEG